MILLVIHEPEERDGSDTDISAQTSIQMGICQTQGLGATTGLQDGFCWPSRSLSISHCLKVEIYNTFNRMHN